MWRGAFNPSTARLAIGKVDCYDGTGPTNSAVAFPKNSDALMTNVVLLAGEAPTAACLTDFETDYQPASLKPFRLWPVSRLKLIACQENATTAAVFIASGNADQCQHLGLAPLPRGFAAAAASAQALANQLRKLYLSRDCWQPRAFARQARATLDKYGYTEWRVVLPMPYKTYSFLGAGQCAAITVPGPNSGDSFQSLDGSTRTLEVDLGIPLSTNRSITRADNELAAKQWSSCYRPSTIKTILEKAFASSRMTPKIAITTNPNGSPGFSWGTSAEARHYQADCLNLFDSWPTPNDRTVLVWFIARNGTPIPTNGYPPPLADFHN